MDVNRMSEEEAHRFLQKRSMDSGIRGAVRKPLAAGGTKILAQEEIKDEFI